MNITGFDQIDCVGGFRLGRTLGGRGSRNLLLLWVALGFVAFLSGCAGSMSSISADSILSVNSNPSHRMTLFGAVAAERTMENGSWRAVPLVRTGYQSPTINHEFPCGARLELAVWFGQSVSFVPTLSPFCSIAADPALSVEPYLAIGAVIQQGSPVHFLSDLGAIIDLRSVGLAFGVGGYRVSTRSRTLGLGLYGGMDFLRSAPGLSELSRIVAR